ncbi:MAG: hypothetical protein M3088_00210 [Actinomycetota bacterium]|nr:hypothetical protein [Actinomycetota bacterium]
MNIGLALLLIAVFLISAVSFLGGAVLKYAVTEGEWGSLDIEATGTLLLLVGIVGFVVFLGCS